MLEIKYNTDRKTREMAGGGDSAVQTFLKLNFVFQKSL